MRRFTDIALLICVALLLGACVGTGSVSQRRPVTGGGEQRIPVPVSAAQEADFDKALALMKKEKYADAIPLLEAILAENDRLPGTWINLAIAQMKLPDDDGQAERFAKAEKALLRAIELNSHEAIAHFQLGLLYRRTGRFEQARKSFEQALQIKPDYAMAHYNLGVLCDIYLQQPDCAVAHFEQYSTLAPEDAEKISLWLADIRRRAGMPATDTTAAAAGGAP